MLSPGERVVWFHAPRGGYGYTFAFPARFVAWLGFDKVRIEIVKRDGEVIPRTVIDANVARDADRVRLNLLRREHATA